MSSGFVSHQLWQMVSHIYRVANQDDHQDMSSGFVSHQLWQMVSHVYCVANQDSSVLHPWAYPIQALVASTSFHLSVSLSSILEAAFLR